MLTSDLVRAKVKGGELRPSWVNPDSPTLRERATGLVEAYAAHVGRPRGELADALAGQMSLSTDHKLQKGLVRLLEQRSEFSTRAAADPKEVRRVVFALAAERGPVVRRAGRGTGTPREQLVAEAAHALSISVAQLEEALFADLESSKWLESFEPLAPEELLHRYNTALAQSVLIRARRVVVTSPETDPKRWRALFRAVKFHGLIHRVRREAGQIRLELDGPLSLTRLATKYGVKLAMFLPALIHANEWSLRAELDWSGHKRAVSFQLDPSAGLRSFQADRGVWVSEDEKYVRERFQAKASEWQLMDQARIISLKGGDVLVPDFALRHPDGRELVAEIIWFWRKGSLVPRLEALAAADAPPNYALLISDKLNAGESGIEGLKVPHLRFKDFPLPAKLIELAENHAAR